MGIINSRGLDIWNRVLAQNVKINISKETKGIDNIGLMDKILHYP